MKKLWPIIALNGVPYLQMIPARQEGKRKERSNGRGSHANLYLNSVMCIPMYVGYTLICRPSFYFKQMIKHCSCNMIIILQTFLTVAAATLIPYGAAICVMHSNWKLEPLRLIKCFQNREIIRRLYNLNAFCTFNDHSLASAWICMVTMLPFCFLRVFISPSGKFQWDIKLWIHMLENNYFGNFASSALHDVELRYLLLLLDYKIRILQFPSVTFKHIILLVINFYRRSPPLSVECITPYKLALFIEIFF